MRHGNQGRPFGATLAYGNFMDGTDGTKDFRAVVAVSATVTNTYGYVFQDNEAAPVLERFALDRPRSHRTRAVFTNDIRT